MRQRFGMILCISGICLLFMPDLNLKQLLADVLSMGAEHWPFGLVIFGLLLLRPHNKKRKS